MLDEITKQRIENVLEGKISKTEAIKRGYTLANRVIVELKNSQRFFIKQAANPFCHA